MSSIKKRTPNSMSTVMKPILLMVLLSLPITAWTLEPEIQEAKEEGMRLYNSYQRSLASPYLEQAAEAGDVDAMYYLGEINRLRHMGLTQAAMDWYLQAAEQGDVHAMLRLFQGGACTAGDECPEGYDDWHYAAMDIVKPQAEAGDPDAMLAMFDIYRMFDESRRAGEWLELAAEAGQPEAQTILGNQILDGRGWYLTNGRRLSAAEAWFRKAAEQGYVPAMNRLSEVLADLDEHESAWQWLMHASEGGHINGRLGEGWCNLNPHEWGDERCPLAQDVVKGWAVLYAIAQETGNRSAKSIMDWNSDELSAEQRKEAEALAEAEWIGREPPLSNFPPRFGY